MLSKKKGSTYEKGGMVGDTVIVSTKILGQKEVMGKIESLSPLKIRTSDNSVVVIPNSAVIDIKAIYAQGGKIEGSKAGAAKRLKIKNWYTKSYPTDDLGKEINDQISFWELYTYMSQGFDFYHVVNVYDSLVRERIFQKLSETLGVEYDVIYKMSLRTSDYAKGGVTKHGLKKGDTLGEFEDNAVIVYPNNEDEKYKVFQVNLNKGVRMDASKYLELSPSEKDAFNKMSRGGTTSAEDKVHNAVLKIRQSYRFPYNAQRGLDELDENGSKYKLAVALLMRKKHPNILPERVIGLNLDDDKDYMRYANMLRHLEKLATAESPNETKWRTENYSLNDAENWATEALEKAYTVSMSGSKKTSVGNTESKPTKKNDEVYVIEYMDSSNNFRPTRVRFIGKNAFEESMKWGYENIENFVGDMVFDERQNRPEFKLPPNQKWTVIDKKFN
jgi:hypothetical protein